MVTNEQECHAAIQQLVMNSVDPYASWDGDAVLGEQVAKYLVDQEPVVPAFENVSAPLAACLKLLVANAGGDLNAALSSLLYTYTNESAEPKSLAHILASLLEMEGKGRS